MGHFKCRRWQMVYLLRTFDDAQTPECSTLGVCATTYTGRKRQFGDICSGAQTSHPEDARPTDAPVQTTEPMVDMCTDSIQRSGQIAGLTGSSGTRRVPPAIPPRQV